MSSFELFKEKFICSLKTITGISAFILSFFIMLAPVALAMFYETWTYLFLIIAAIPLSALFNAMSDCLME